MSITRDLIINGEHVPALSGRTAEDINPYTGEVFATVAAAGAQNVTRAVDAAAKGAAVRAGGHRLESSLVPATVLTGVTPQTDISERRWITVQEHGHARFPF